MNFNNRLVLELNNTGTRRTGREGACYAADGVDDYVTTGTGGNSVTGKPASIMAWVNISSSRNVFAYPFGAWRSGAERAFSIMTGVTVNQIWVAYNNVTPINKIYAGLEDAWHHIAAIYDGENVILYIDGVSQDQKAVTEIVDSAFDAAFIGRNNGANVCDCSVFDVRYYSTPITQDELNYIYTFGESGTDPTNASLLSQYKCDEGDGIISYDSSMNSNHGTITNATLATFHATQDIYSFQNQVGYNLSGSVYIPRDESDPTNDVLGNPLTYTGVRPNDGALINSNCLTLNGTNQAVRVADNTALDITDNLTVSVWAKNDNALLSTFATMVGKYDAGSNKREFFLGLNSSEKIYVAIGSAGGTSASAEISSDAIDPTELHHYVATFKSGTVKLYMNGVLIPSTKAGAHVTTLNNEDADLTIGSILNSGTPAYLWDGQILDARIYAGDSTVLTAEQIASIYADPTGNIEFTGQSLRAHYKLAEGSGTACLDASGNANHGAIENAASNWGVTQDVYHSNFMDGFTLYEHASSDPIRVPYDKNGQPVTGFTPPSGYTLTAECPFIDGFRNRAETEFDFNPDSTPEMGVTQLGITVPTAHAFGDVLPGYNKMFSRKTDTSEDRFIVFKDSLHDTNLTRIREYTGKSAYPLDPFRDSLVGVWSTRQLVSNPTNANQIIRGRDAVTTEQDFSSAAYPAGVVALAAGSYAFCPKLYDQIGTNDAAQTTAASQPKLVDTGVLEVDGSGRPVLSFDGTNDAFLLTNQIILSADFTLNFNLKFNSTSPQHILHGPTYKDRFYLNDVSSFIFIANDELDGFATDVPINILYYYNVTLTRLSGLLSLYINGVAQSDTELNSSTLTITRISNSISSPLNTDLGSVCVFNRALSASEVAQLHAALV